VLVTEYLGVRGSLVGGIRKEIPSGEFEPIERRQRYEGIDALVATPCANRAHLSQRPDGLTEAAPREQHAGDERGGDGTHAG
jgi:hypothetical protein